MDTTSPIGFAGCRTIAHRAVHHRTNGTPRQFMFCCVIFFAMNHTHSQAHTHARTHTRTHTHSLSLSLTHTHTHTLTCASAHAPPPTPHPATKKPLDGRLLKFNAVCHPMNIRLVVSWHGLSGEFCFRFRFVNLVVNCPCRLIRDGSPGRPPRLSHRLLSSDLVGSVLRCS